MLGNKKSRPCAEAVPQCIYHVPKHGIEGKYMKFQGTEKQHGPTRTKAR